MFTTNLPCRVWVFAICFFYSHDIIVRDISFQMLDSISVHAAGAQEERPVIGLWTYFKTVGGGGGRQELGWSSPCRWGGTPRPRWWRQRRLRSPWAASPCCWARCLSSAQEVVITFAKYWRSSMLKNSCQTDCQKKEIKYVTTFSAKMKRASHC